MVSYGDEVKGSKSAENAVRMKVRRTVGPWGTEMSQLYRVAPPLQREGFKGGTLKGVPARVFVDAHLRSTAFHQRSTNVPYMLYSLLH
jgi:hypothetical protein